MTNKFMGMLNEMQLRFAESIVCEVEGCRVVCGAHQKYCSKHRIIAEMNNQHKEESDAYNPVVYFIIGIGTDLVKIGRTTNISGRLGTLQTGSPVKLLLVTTIYGNEAEETAIHKLLSKYREHGEWFRMTDEVIEVIETAEKEGQYGINVLLYKAGIDKAQPEDYDISMIDIEDFYG